jgi:hypothetical protein
MKHIKFATMTVALAMAVLFSSCEKDDDTIDANANTSASLSAGRAGLVFNTNTNFVTNTAFDVRNTAQTQASSTTSGSLRNINLTAAEFTGSASFDSRVANVSIQLPIASTTAQGSLTSDLSNPGFDPRPAIITLSSNTGATLGTSYSSTSGTLTITKLTETEIEGVFNATVQATGGGTGTMTITNGSFAGKF